MEGAIIQLLSLFFGSAAVVLVADLGLDGVDALVMVTVVLVPVVVVVFNVEAAGFTAGSAPGCAAAGSVKPAGSPVPPTGTSFPSVSPAGVVAPSGSINTCAAGRRNKPREHKQSARARGSAIGTDGLARVAVKLQVVGIGPGPAGARNARLAVRRARCIRRPAEQNVLAGNGGKHLAVSFNEKSNHHY